MKKVVVSFFAILITVFAFALSACTNKESGTYYPSSEEMKVNLENNGYFVEVYKDVYWFNSEAGEPTKYESKALRARNETGEYIQFYWIETQEASNYYFNRLEETYQDSELLVKIKNDEKFGSIAYCGTSAAVNDAGIRVVKVNVKV